MGVEYPDVSLVVLFFIKFCDLHGTKNSVAKVVVDDKPIVMIWVNKEILNPFKVVYLIIFKAR